ncbi:hypothetical protein [Streptomyces sp. NPDC003832]
METASEAVSEEAGAVAAPAAEHGTGTDRAEHAADEAEQAGEAEASAIAAFSPEGSKLYLRASAALSKFDGAVESAEDAESDTESDTRADAAIDEATDTPADVETADEADAETVDNTDVEPEADPDAALEADAPEETGTDDTTEALTPVPADDAPKRGASANTSASTSASTTAGTDREPERADHVQASVATPARESGDTRAEVPAQHDGSSQERAARAAAQEDEAQGKPEADAQEHGHAAATTGRPALPAPQPSGHFVAPTAVAVAPTAPVRRPMVEGGFDFFGMQKDAAPAALEAVQNEDLADVVGEEALALHKAEAEAEFKPADAESRGIGQVIDLTAHDETEHIDVEGLRSAVS